MMPDTDVRVEFRFKNARLYHAIRDAAFKDKDHNRSFDRGRVSAFCRFYSVSYNLVTQLLNLQLSPVFRNRTYRPICVTLANILNIDCDRLFPPALYAQVWPRGLAADIPLVTFVSLSAAKHLALPEASSEAVAKRELRELLAAALQTLTPREATILTRRFGLDGTGEHTQNEVGQEFTCSAARVAQIEARAMRKLRHPMRSHELRPFLRGPTDWTF